MVCHNAAEGRADLFCYDLQADNKDTDGGKDQVSLWTLFSNAYNYVVNGKSDGVNSHD